MVRSNYFLLYDWAIDSNGWVLYQVPPSSNNVIYRMEMNTSREMDHLVIDPDSLIYCRISTQLIVHRIGILHKDILVFYQDPANLYDKVARIDIASGICLSAQTIVRDETAQLDELRFIVDVTRGQYIISKTWGRYDLQRWNITLMSVGSDSPVAGLMFWSERIDFVGYDSASGDYLIVE